MNNEKTFCIIQLIFQFSFRYRDRTVLAINIDILRLFLCQLMRNGPINLKLYQVLIFDMSFQKNNIRGRSLTVEFFYRRFYANL